MIKFIGIVLFFFCQNVLCQEYHFDKAFTYEEKRSEYSHTFTEIFMIDSSNNDYFVMMITTSKSNGNGIKTYIYDLKTKLIHKFFVKKISDKLDYEYLNSTNINDSKCNYSMSLFELKESFSDNQNYKVVINKYNNTTEKKIIGFCDIKVKPMENCNLKPFLNRFYKNYNCCELLNFPENYIPESITIKYEDNTMNNAKLIGADNVSYIISLNRDKIKINE